MNIANCTFHHIGYTVEDIEASAKEFEQWGYTVSETVHDEALTVDLCYLRKAGAPDIELVHQHNPASLEIHLFQQNGVCPYHLGFETVDIDVATAELEAMGYKRLFDPVPVAALGGTRICYYHHPEIGYIELLEQMVR